MAERRTFGHCMDERRTECVRKKGRKNTWKLYHKGLSMTWQEMYYLVENWKAVKEFKQVSSRSSLSR